MPHVQKCFTIFMDFSKIKNTVVFEKICDKVILKHPLRGVLLSRISEIFGPNLLTFQPSTLSETNSCFFKSFDQKFFNMLIKRNNLPSNSTIRTPFSGCFCLFSKFFSKYTKTNLAWLKGSGFDAFDLTLLFL